MMSDAFKHRMRTHFEVIKDLNETLDAEKRTTMLRWKKQESIISKIDSNTTNFYGELKALVPQLPQIDQIPAYLRLPDSVRAHPPAQCMDCIGRGYPEPIEEILRQADIHRHARLPEA